MDDVVVEEVDEGLIVFDRLGDTAHWLDPAAAAVWRLANGHSDVATIAAAIDTSEAEVADVILRLDGLNLMVEQSGGGISRRAALKRIAKIGGAAAAGAAVISTVAVPNALATTSVCDKIACTGTAQYCGDAAANAAAYCRAQAACGRRSSCEGSCHTSGGTSTYSGMCLS